jgi:UDP-2,4-diacetamido-2,4,6-trideoxy-beta-L-altropyranose hydrolase
MPRDRQPFALFRVAAGARLGYGHLRRATVLARTLRRPCAISVRGGGVVPAEWATAPRQARAALGLGPRLLVIDDPRADASLPWLREARRQSVPTASLHDLGIAPVPTDLAVDGSLCVARTRWPARRHLVGVDYAVLDVRPRRRQPLRRTSGRPRVLVSFGGGDHRALLGATVEALARALPDARLIVPTGLGRTTPDSLARVLPSSSSGSAVDVVAARDGLAPLLRRADMAILAGGVTLYEAAALGVPAIAMPVVPAQRPTIEAFARAGLVISMRPRASHDATAGVLAARARQLLDDATARAQMAARGMATVDGRGAERVARALVALAEEGRV